MLMQELHDHYGSWAVMAREFHFNKTTYLVWRKKGYIPYATQCFIEVESNRRFIASRDHDKKEK